MCIHCGANINKRKGWLNLWRAKGTSLATHNPEYCPESPNHSHRPATKTEKVAQEMTKANMLGLSLDEYSDLRTQADYILVD
jgi:hypothetical protein